MTIALAVLVVLIIGWQGATNLRLNRLLRNYRALSYGAEGQPLDEILQRLITRAESGNERVEYVLGRLDQLEAAVQGHLQHVGIVRYNAFQDTGGDQSFALAMLDANGNGALFNGLFHRTECRVYAKPVHAWRSSYSLSDEEEEAIRKARGGVQPDG